MKKIKVIDGYLVDGKCCHIALGQYEIDLYLCVYGQLAVIN